MDDKDRRKGYYEDATTTFVKYFFHTRFFLSRLTRRSKIAKKIIDKMLFEDDEVYVLPNKNAINKTTISGNNHINTLNITTATKIAIIMNAKSLSSI